MYSYPHCVLKYYQVRSLHRSFKVGNVPDKSSSFQLVVIESSFLNRFELTVVPFSNWFEPFKLAFSNWFELLRVQFSNWFDSMRISPWYETGLSFWKSSDWSKSNGFRRLLTSGSRHRYWKKEKKIAKLIQTRDMGWYALNWIENIYLHVINFTWSKYKFNTLKDVKYTPTINFLLLFY